MKLVDIENIFKIYKSGSETIPIETVALKDVSFTINEGDFISVMGSSGSGKTTLLSILGGLDKPSAGNIVFHERGENFNLTRMDEKKLDNFRRDKIGVIFQADNLIPHLTALENVELPLRFLGRKNSSEDARKVLEKIGLKDRFNFLPNQLSGGEKQRVALASVLAYKPRLILADEPSGELDQANVKQVMELFSQIHKEENITFFLVTHNASVAKYANRFFTIYDGTLIEQSNLDSYETVHSESGDYLVTVDKLGRMTIPHELIVNIPIIDGIISYGSEQGKIRITSFDEDNPSFASIDSRNRIMFNSDINGTLEKGSYRANYDPNQNEIIIFIKEELE